MPQSGLCADRALKERIPRDDVLLREAEAACCQFSNLEYFRFEFIRFENQGPECANAQSP
jgi:hypothetical protein